MREFCLSDIESLYTEAVIGRYATYALLIDSFSLVQFVWLVYPIWWVDKQHWQQKQQNIKLEKEEEHEKTAENSHNFCISSITYFHTCLIDFAINYFSCMPLNNISLIKHLCFILPVLGRQVRITSVGRHNFSVILCLRSIFCITYTNTFTYTPSSPSFPNFSSLSSLLFFCLNAQTHSFLFSLFCSRLFTDLSKKWKFNIHLWFCAFEDIFNSSPFSFFFISFFSFSLFPTLQITLNHRRTYKITSDQC